MMFSLVVSGAVTLRALGSQQDDGRVPFPVASRITVSQTDASDMVTVTGQADAVLPNRDVYVVDLNMGAFSVTRSDGTGSFTTAVRAPAGSTLMVRVETRVGLGFPEGPVRELDGASANFMTTPGTFLRVPVGPSATQGVPFYYVAQSLTDDPRYVTVGGSINTLEVSAGDTVTVRGKLRVFYPQPEPRLNGLVVGGRISCVLLFSANGEEHPLGTEFVSGRLAPTGVPIESYNFGTTPCESVLMTDPLEAVDTQTYMADFEVTSDIPTDLPDGWYAVKANLYLNDLPDLIVNDEENNQRTRTQKGAPPDVDKTIGILRVGQPDTPKLSAMLLANTFDNGPRGVVSREDRGHYQISSRIAFQNDKLIIPRFKSSTGEPITYQLEPFLPMLSFADRSFPFPPPVHFQFPSGELRVSITDPDGRTEDLGSAPFVQASCLSAANEEGFLQDDGSGHVDDMLRLTTLSDQFRHQFSKYGPHVITLDGNIQDEQGRTYLISQSYDVVIAETLDINLGTLPSTPLGPGDVLSPVIKVSPPVPADFEITLRQFPDSDSNQLLTTTATGTCNRFGYGVANPGLSPNMDRPGEYVIDVTASYTDGSGKVYMGILRAASIIATRDEDAIIIAHGQRGIDGTDSIGPLWFDRDETGIAIGGNHLHLPYANGDVQWLENEDSVITLPTVEDPGGQLAGALRARDKDGRLPYVPNLEARIGADQIPLLSATTTGVVPTAPAAVVDLQAYAYISIQRADVRVQEMITDDTQGTAYWRFDTLYGRQLGMGIEGDLPNEIKFQYAGIVYRDGAIGINQYARYGSLFVLVDDNDSKGSRVYPPFQGNPGGHDGGPLLTLQGRDVDLLVVPTAVRPGSVLETGDTFSFAAHLGPTLPCDVSVQVIAPTGDVKRMVGKADSIGYYYDPKNDFVVDQPGVYNVQVNASFDGATSAGQVQEPFPTGSVLGTEDNTFEVYSVPKDAQSLSLNLPQEKMIDGASPLTISGTLPDGVASGSVHLTVWMPGYLLMQETRIFPLDSTAAKTTPHNNVFSTTVPSLAGMQIITPFAGPHRVFILWLLFASAVVWLPTRHRGLGRILPWRSVCGAVLLMGIVSCGGSGTATTTGTTLDGGSDHGSSSTRTFTFSYDAATLSQQFPNVDTDWSDTVYFSLFLDGNDSGGGKSFRARSFSLHGRHLLNP